MDPASHRMMAVRSDLTPQIARIAASRLGRSPRPLRLSYAGEILRVRGSELRPERGFRQVGFELIGIGAGAACDAEVILLAAHALDGLGIAGGLSVDLNAPTLVASLLPEEGIDADDSGPLLEALDRKDAAAVAEADAAVSDVLLYLMRATGAARDGARRARAARAPRQGGGGARTICWRWPSCCARRAPALPLTVDPVEWRGFEYHTGTSFSLFAGGVRTELGRGGRYSVEAGAAAEEAAGCTLYTDTLAPGPRRSRRRGAGYTSPAARRRAKARPCAETAGSPSPASPPERDPAAEAARLGCSHVWRDGAALPLGGED